MIQRKYCNSELIFLDKCIYYQLSSYFRGYCIIYFMNRDDRTVEITYK